MKINVSILSSTIKPQDIVKELDNTNADAIHIDIMDGKFVENKTWTIGEITKITKYSSLPLDVHLMVNNPSKYIEDYAMLNTNDITFHYEACKNKEEVMNLINYIKEKGRRVGISVKPGTAVKEILEFLPYVHVVLVMTVEPGKGGQELILPTIEKIKELNSYREEHKLDYEIEADGGIKVENSKKIIDAGADILVAGTAIINSKDYAETIKKLK